MSITGCYKRFTIENQEIFPNIFEHVFKINFLHEKWKFSDIFFWFHLLVEADWSKWVPEWFQQFKGEKTQGKKVFAEIRWFLEYFAVTLDLTMIFRRFDLNQLQSVSGKLKIWIAHHNEIYHFFNDIVSHLRSETNYVTVHTRLRSV